jgi:hypothetical protein
MLVDMSNIYIYIYIGKKFRLKIETSIKIQNMVNIYIYVGI